MKNIYSIMIVALVGFALFAGIANIGNYQASKGNLDEESVNAVLLYNSRLLEMNQSFNNITLDSDFQPNNNQITDFFKEYYEHKSRLDELIDTINLIYKIPDIMIYSVPFVDDVDLSFYRNTFWLLLIATVLIAIMAALRQGAVAADNT